MSKNPYGEALKEEAKEIDSGNPFADIEKDNKSKQVNVGDSKENRKIIKSAYYEEKQKSNNYFSLILDSDFKTIEMEIRGLRYVTYNDPKTGKKIVELERKDDHYLSQQGGEYILNYLQMNTSTDLKLGHLTEKEFKQTMDLLIKSFIRFIRQNLEKFGADTYEKQDKTVQLTIATLNRIRSVYSRSIEGQENRRSHGDITLSGNLEGDREDKFNLEETRN